MSLVTVGVFFVASALRVIFGGIYEDAAAREEYAMLREEFPILSSQSNVEDEVLDVEEESTVTPEEPSEDDEFDLKNLSLDELARINNDFIGWINIGNVIDYPVVRGRDNEKYINTTFTGNHNSAGAIFMDYRQSKGFDERVSIIYGHYTRDGSMFSPLGSYLNPSYLRQNPIISITTRDGRMLTYRIFAAKLTDAWDPAYTISLSDGERAVEEFPDVPNNARNFMLLSTCTRSNNQDERILVFAATTN